MTGDEGFYPQSDRPPVLTPLHEPGPMPLREMPLRQECWDRLPSSLRKRLHALAGGTALAWWARIDDGARRPFAIVFGEGGLFVAEPVDGGGRFRPRPHAVSGAEIVAGSLSTDYVDHTSLLDGSSSNADSGADESAAGPATEIAGLDHAAKAFLGNLPSRAQQLLQGPFAAGQEIRYARWFYEGRADKFDAFLFILRGDQDLTVAAGTMEILEGHTGATAHWSLQVHRALVKPWAEYPVV